MLIKIGHQLCQIHEKLKIGKDNAFIPLVKILPRWVTPNHVTLFRFIIVLVWLPFALFRPALNQVVIFLIVGFLDLYDGAVARFKNQATYFGKYFDTFCDRLNRVPLFIVLLSLTNYRIVTFKLFIGWDLLTALFIVVEYFLKSHKVVHVRTLVQFCARFALWISLIYEVVQVYGG